MLAERPDLRIISEPLWNAVQKRLKAVKQNYIREQSGTLWAGPRPDGCPAILRRVDGRN